MSNTPPRPGGEEWHIPPDFVEEHGVLIYRGKTPFEELPFPLEPPPPDPDSEWAWNDPEVRRLYAGLFVAVHARKVWGAGIDEDAAWEDASKKPGCPPEKELRFVPVFGTPPGLGGAE